MRKFTIKGTGPLTRSTVGADGGDVRWEATTDALHWIWSWRLQVERHAESTKRDGAGSTNLERLQAFSATSYDEHMLAVVGWHLVRAIARANDVLEEIALDPALADALQLLRHIYEHWDEQRPVFQDPSIPKKLSAKHFDEKFPDGQPWSVAFTAEDWMLGGVVPIRGLTRSLSAIEERLLEIQAQLREASKED